MKKNFLAAILLAGMMSAGGAAWAAGEADAAPWAAVMAAAAQQDEKTVTSPDGVTFLKVGLKDGRAYYKVGYYADGKEGRKEVMMLEESPLFSWQSHTCKRSDEGSKAVRCKASP